MSPYRLQDALYIPFNGVMEWAIQLNNGLYLHHADLATLSKMVWHKNNDVTLLINERQAIK